MSLAIHNTSRTLLLAALNGRPSSLLISGDEGIGLMTITKTLCAPIHAILAPEAHTSNSSDGTISVDMIRSLYEQTRGVRSHRSVVIIDDADTMTLGAQSAFLKLLEEPPAGTWFVLTSHRPQLLLPTIRSRVQHVVLQKLTPKESDTFLASCDVTDGLIRKQIDFLARGCPAEIHRLAKDDKYFQEQASIIRDAKSILSGNSYDTLRLGAPYWHNRSGTLRLLRAMMRMLGDSLRSSPTDTAVLQLQLLVDMYDSIQSNCNIKLQLARLVVQ